MTIHIYASDLSNKGCKCYPLPSDFPSIQFLFLHPYFNAEVWLIQNSYTKLRNKSGRQVLILIVSHLVVFGLIFTFC